jgi:riboflavin synthase
MFTGIILETGKVRAVTNRGGNTNLAIESSIVRLKLETGSSVAVNGVCLTVVELAKGSFVVEAIEETLSRTNLGELQSGSPVNLEPPVTPEGMLHGHLVQGHVDCTGKVSDVRRIDGSHVFEIQFPADLGKYVVEKGSVAVDGISLTIVECGRGFFSVAAIPHTLENTILKYRIIGQSVNLEFDMIAKYIERLMVAGKSELTYSFLKEHGFG